MNKINFTLQGKGGVGKSFVSLLLAQYFQGQGGVICADTDPVNATFSQYQALDVTHVDIAENGNVLQRKFDPLMESVLQTTSDVVIDNGAATFLPLTRYLAENEIYQVMAEAGKQVYVHTVLTGGQAKSDTFNGFAELVRRVDGHAKVVVWENEFWGPVEFDGHRVQEGAIFQEARRAGKIAGIVRIADRSQSDTFTGDIKQMTESHLTLPEVLASQEFTFLAKNRLRRVIGDVFAELDRVDW